VSIVVLTLTGCSVVIDVGQEQPSADQQADLDGDGYRPLDGDCDDENAQVSPNHPEDCDGLDNDCDGRIDLDGNTDICQMEQVFEQRSVLDVLLVVDNSFDSEDLQARVANGADEMVEALLTSGADVHLGVITTDMDDADHQGRLIERSGLRWISSEEPEAFAVGWLQEVVQVGSDGSFNERGRAAAYQAMTTELDGHNDGFLRDHATAQVVFISDDTDNSGTFPSVTSYLDFLSSLKGGLDRVAVHAIVDDDGECGSIGDDYIQLVDVTAGLLHDVCDPGYGTFLGDLGAVAAQRSLLDRFGLTVVPDPESISVEIRFPSGFVHVPDGSSWDWMEATNEVVLDSPPSVGSDVTVHYRMDPFAP